MNRSVVLASHERLDPRHRAGTSGERASSITPWTITAVVRSTGVQRDVLKLAVRGRS